MVHIENDSSAHFREKSVCRTTCKCSFIWFLGSLSSFILSGMMFVCWIFSTDLHLQGGHCDYCLCCLHLEFCVKTRFRIVLYYACLFVHRRTWVSSFIQGFRAEVYLFSGEPIIFSFFHFSWYMCMMTVLLCLLLLSVFFLNVSHDTCYGFHTEK